jgi:hypothetical protein
LTVDCLALLMYDDSECRKIALISGNADRWHPKPAAAH